MRRQRWMARFIAFVFSLVLLGLWWSVGCAAPLVSVQTARGTVTVKRRSAPRFVGLSAGSTLNLGDTVKTGPNGKAALLFSNGSVVRLNSNAAIVVNPAATSRGRRSLFQVLYGEAAADFSPHQGAHTRSVTMGARGTRVDIKVDEDGTTTLAVIEGEVDFFNEFGAVVVGQLQQSVAHPGAAPTSPITIANPGLIIEWTLDLNQAVIPREKFFVTPDRRALAPELQGRRTAALARPNDPQARRDYGDALFDDRQYAAAWREYEAINQVQPDQPEVLARIGYTQLELKQPDEAGASFRRALPTDAAQAGAAQVPALVGLAALYLVQERPDLAQAMAERALALDGISAEASIQLGLALMRQPGKLGEAAQAFQAALAAPQPGYAYQARAWLGLVYLAQDDRTAALREAQTAARAMPQSALARGNLALVLLYSGKIREAEREAQVARALNPESVAANVALGQVLLAHGDVDEARDVAARAAALDPELPQASYLLGLADASRNDYTHAARELTRALRLAPEFLPAVSALARVYNRMGRRQEAVTLLTDMLPRHREVDAVRAALGQLYYEQARYPESVAQYQQALKLKPNSALYHAEMARVLLYSNQLSAATNAAQQAVQVAPEIGQFHSNLGLAYFFSGLTAQAEREFRTALTLDPQDSLARARLGLQATDLSTQENSLTQAFLIDPAVTSQLLRGGIDTEMTPSVGDNGQRSFVLNHRDVAADGALHDFGFLNRSRDTGLNKRPNEEESQTTFAEYATFNLRARTNVFGNIAHSRGQQGLPGPVTGPLGADRDDHFWQANDIAQFSLRHRLSTGRYLWAGFVYQPSQQAIFDPDQKTFPPFPVPVGPFRVPLLGAMFTTRSSVPEVRLDWTLNPAAEHPALLSLGAARASLRQSIEQQAPPFTSHPVVDGRLTVGYAQLSTQVNDRISFIGQLRQQERNLRPNTGAPPAHESLFLPSMVASYRADQRTTLRLFANRHETDITTIALTPTETLLTTEATALPNGIAGRADTLELDVDRYLPPAAFLKLFMFRTAAEDLRLGADTGAYAFQLQSPLSLKKVWHSGVGARYERSLGGHLYGQTSLRLSRTTDRTPGAAFSTLTAPYQPSQLAGLTLAYISPGGTKVRLGMDRVGSFYQDTPLITTAGRPGFPAHTYVNLSVAKEPSVHTEVFVILANLTNQSQIAFNGVPLGGRRLQAGVTRRF